jgi:hypothetical protein
MAQYRTFDRRMSFWVGQEQGALLERACETLGFNRSEMARRLFLFLDRPKEDIRKIFGKKVNGYEYPSLKKI